MQRGLSGASTAPWKYEGGEEEDKTRYGPSWSVNKILLVLKTLYLRNIFL